MVVFQDPILRFLGGGPAGEAASTVLLLGAATQALYGLVFWHSTLLFAANRTAPMSRVSVVAVIVHIAAMVVLIPAFEATGAAIALLISQATVNVALTTLALRTLRSADDRAGDRSGAGARGLSAADRPRRCFSRRDLPRRARARSSPWPAPVPEAW